MNEKEKPYGSAHFGQWIRDEFGFPAYEYTCNQYIDDKARTPMNEMWRSNRDHYFLVGNDRVVGVASNFGYVKLRQDEGGPKYLNYYEPKLNQYAGGFGYLRDNSSELGTFYSEESNHFKRIFGIGYYLKEVANERYKVKQVIFTPYGDDPILISKTTIKNKGAVEAEVSWFEYWGCFNFQFSFQAVIDAINAKKAKPLKDYRLELGFKFKNKTLILRDGRGLFNMKYDVKSSLKEKLVDFELRSSGKQIKREHASFEDKVPPPIFLISLDAPADGCGNNSEQFFGLGGVTHPDGLKRKLNFNEDLIDYQTCLILERKLKLKPLKEKTIFFAYGYIPIGFNLNHLIEKYSLNPEVLFESSIKNWFENRIHFELNDTKWIDREIFWHYYYLRGLLSYDSYFEEHILSQGHVYQHIVGFQGAARDPLQHALPFIFSNPDFVKQIIRYTLKEVQEDGKIPYGITGNGMIMPSLWDPSDLELWLLWITSEYVLSLRDINFLNNVITRFPVHGRKVKQSTIKELLYLVYDHFVNSTGKGSHGLIRVASCDWNDMVITGHVPEEKQNEVKKVGESCLNTAMAIHVLNRFTEMLIYVGCTEKVAEIQDFRESLIKPLRKQWNGRWFKRAWLSEELGWVGDNELWLEPQPWAIISDILSENQKSQLVKSINQLIRNPSPIGAILLSKPIASNVESIGMATNAGIWPSINGTLIWALSLVDGNLAYDEWKKNTLAYKSDIYPDIWYGIWSGPDTWNSIHSDYPGHTLFDKYYMTRDEQDRSEVLLSMGINWTDFPVFNLHPHAWPLYNIFHLIGTTFSKEGIEFTPILEDQEYSIYSPLLSFEKGVGFYKGYYLPQIKDNFSVKLTLGKTTINSIKEIRVNGISSTYEEIGEAVIFQGEGGNDKALTWEVILQ